MASFSSQKSEHLTPEQKVHHTQLLKKTQKTKHKAT
jgi:hypothetical protein